MLNVECSQGSLSASSPRTSPLSSSGGGESRRRVSSIRRLFQRSSRQSALLLELPLEVIFGHGQSGIAMSVVSRWLAFVAVWTAAAVCAAPAAVRRAGSARVSGPQYVSLTSWARANEFSVRWLQRDR